MRQVVAREMFARTRGLTVQRVQIRSRVLGIGPSPRVLMRSLFVSLSCEKKKLFSKVHKKNSTRQESTSMPSALWDCTENSGVEGKCHLLSRYFMKDKKRHTSKAALWHNNAPAFSYLLQHFCSGWIFETRHQQFVWGHSDQCVQNLMGLHPVINTHDSKQQMLTSQWY